MAKEYPSNLERDVGTATAKIKNSKKISEKNKKIIRKFSNLQLGLVFQDFHKFNILKQRLKKKPHYTR